MDILRPTSFPRLVLSFHRWRNRPQPWAPSSGCGRLPLQLRSLATVTPEPTTTPPASAPTTPVQNYAVDVLVVGSGAAALTASLRLHALGLKPLVVEKTSLVGGTTCYSGGALWIPNSGVRSSTIIPDDFDRALTYMKAVIDDGERPATRPSTLARKVAFLKEGPKMVKFLASQGFRWIRSTGYPDYYPELPGGNAGGGRTIEPVVFDLNRLPREWRGKVRKGTGPNVPVYGFEAGNVYRMRSLDGMLTLLKVGGRVLGQRALGRQPVTLGMSLFGQVLLFNVQRGIPIWTGVALESLNIDDRGNVVGATISRDDGKNIANIQTRKGVVLAAGGFARSASMRAEHHLASGGSHSLASPGDTGDAITAAVQIGAATELMDEAWWGAVVVDRAGEPAWMQYERALPHSIIVDKQGKRFTNEAVNYTRFVHEQFRAGAVPAYLIVDSKNRGKYILAGIPPGRGVSQGALESGLIVKADSLRELAVAMGIDEMGLEETVRRFNQMAEKGVDEDFGRGSSSYDKFFADPKHRPNGNLGPVSRPPFYAARVYPGDLGTKGGVLTDEHARALRDDGNVISGLYAVGNSSASVMGKEYLGAGSTLGPGLTFAYIAANHIALPSAEK
ncbi:FAD binding domain-containing protein [Mycena maculata]|uniref:FAD binding domain-containing protein n=1 Tax=Mycena maculata TaxID=230809 RepID=A0AAD7J497_9AGAR|nr:FAD binding domain-containing protein [Mycena maculata]